MSSENTTGKLQSFTSPVPHCCWIHRSLPENLQDGLSQALFFQFGNSHLPKRQWWLSHRRAWEFRAPPHPAQAVLDVSGFVFCFLFFFELILKQSQARNPPPPHSLVARVTSRGVQLGPVCFSKEWHLSGGIGSLKTKGGGGSSQQELSPLPRPQLRSWSQEENGAGLLRTLESRASDTREARLRSLQSEMTTPDFTARLKCRPVT